MNSKSLLNYMKEENRVFHFLDKLLLVLYPVLFLLGLYLFSRYVKEINFTLENDIFFFLTLLLTLIIFEWRALARDNKDIENIVERESSYLPKENGVFRRLITYRGKYRLWGIIASICLLIPFGLSLFPGRPLSEYYQEIFALLVLAYVLVEGMTEMIAFVRYMNDVLLLFNNENDVKMVNLNYKKTVIITFFVVSFVAAILVMTQMSILHLFLFVLSFGVVCFLGLGLTDTYKQFYRYLAELDRIRISKKL